MKLQGRFKRDLPAPRTPLIGRERDVAEVSALLVSGTERLVTLTGIGGGGKTRLALEVAENLTSHVRDGVFLIELASISDPHLVPEVVARALGARGMLGEAPLDALIGFLRPLALLLVLDNCEHLIDSCASLADSLLSACPKLRILAASREPLKIAGERQRPLAGLPVPPVGASSAGELANWPAVQLFVARASAADPGFALTSENAAGVATICRVLGGIPLALELAAARAQVLSIGQILRRLDDCPQLLAGYSRSMPARQQTLKATMDWSYQLLSPEEKMAFRRLATFAGSWSLEAADTVCATGAQEAGGALERITRLVEKSLVVVEEQGDEARFRLLAPVRQYGMQLLAEHAEAEDTQARLATFYIALAEHAEQELRGPRQRDWFRRLDREFDNIRAVLKWSEERGDAEAIMRLVGSLHWYFWMRRYLREATGWLGGALARESPAPPQVRAKALYAMGLVLGYSGELHRAEAHVREALALYRETSDTIGIGLATTLLGGITFALGDLALARALAEEAISLSRGLGAPWLLAYGLIGLGQVLRCQREADRAIALHEQARALLAQCGDEWGVNYALASLGCTYYDRPAMTRAGALCGVRLCWEQGDYQGLAAALEYLANSGDTRNAEWRVKLFAAAAGLRTALGEPSAVDSDHFERFLFNARALLGAVRFTAAWNEGRAMPLRHVVANVLAEVHSAAGAQARPMPGSAAGPDTLTAREREIAGLLVRGLSDREIADALCITAGTTRLHVHHILDKLGLHSRLQLIRSAPALVR